jgi:hypothetical protein
MMRKSIGSISLQKDVCATSDGSENWIPSFSKPRKIARLKTSLKAR